jgi:serine/threonine-protein kinase RsbW
VKTLKKKIETRLELLEEFSKEFRLFCDEMVHDDKLVFNLELCLNEALTNAIKHAHEGKPGRFIDIVVDLNHHEILVKVIHEGNSIPNFALQGNLDFDPKNIETLPESGMGLFLIKKIMDDVSWNLRENRVELIMRKCLDSTKD